MGKSHEYEEYGGTWEGIPYFVNERTIKKLLTDTRYAYYVDRDHYWATYKIIELGKNKAVVFSVHYISGSADEIFSVKEGKYPFVRPSEFPEQHMLP